MDDFHKPLLEIPPAPEPSGFITGTLNVIRSSGVAPLHIILTIFLASAIAILATRQLSERPSSLLKDKNGQTVWMPAYWVPGIGHTISFLRDPAKLMTEARDQSAHGIFALNVGGTSHNIISNPDLVKNVMQQKESDVSFIPVAWELSVKFFGLPKSSEKKYIEHWENLNKLFGYLMKEPYLSRMLDNTTNNLEKLIPQMVSFVESPIDQQPWERYANAEYISSKEMEVDLMALVRDVMGHASVPSVFGRALLENCPHVLHDIYDLDDGMMYFMAGLPWWTPWPSVARAYFARSQAWDSMTKFHKALDASVDGKHVDPSWGDMDDISDFIMKRHEAFRNAGLAPEERADISIIWALVINSTLLVYWHVLYILSTPGLLSEILTEIAPYVTITPGETIGSFTEAPKLHLSHEGLSKNCPLFKSTYFESLRLSNQPLSVRKISNPITISTASTDNNDKTSYYLPANEHVTIPHNLHMQDPAYFSSPTTFNPTRFLTPDKKSTDPGTIRPYGGGGSMCKGRLYAERECLAMVAGILMFWEIEPAAGMKGKWTIPEMKRTSAMAKPMVDTRVRIRRRVV
ncbi:hypothetical protein ACMFMG_008455 [Clarireedia jacksonii]